MTPTEKALAKIEQHEETCGIRYESIDNRLNAGEKRFDRLEMMIWGVYVVVMIAVALPQFLNG
jgi:predicted nucleic acid-binding Zn ribbon protein